MGVLNIPFTPQSASINRIRIVALPGIDLDEIVVGEQAYNLLSVPTMVRYILAHADALQLPHHYTLGHPDRFELRRDLPRFLEMCLNASDRDVQSTAEQITQQLGRNLGYILLTLHKGDSVNRDARKDWTSDAWDIWHRIRNIYIGGGVVSGFMGDRIVEIARGVIAKAGYHHAIKVLKSPFTQSMALIGASRYLPAHTQNALCIDFGQTSIKAAIACFENRCLSNFIKLPTESVNWHWSNHPDAGRNIDPQKVLNRVTNCIINKWQLITGMGINLDPDIMLSIAAYVQGRKLLGNGIYARMNQLSEDVSVLLAQELQKIHDLKTNIHLIHDGSAAAALHAGEINTAVLVIGTALGAGFAPDSEDLLHPIHPDIMRNHRSDSLFPL